MKINFLPSKISPLSGKLLRRVSLTEFPLLSKKVCFRWQTDSALDWCRENFCKWLRRRLIRKRHCKSIRPIPNIAISQCFCFLSICHLQKIPVALYFRHLSPDDYWLIKAARARSLADCAPRAIITFPAAAAASRIINGSRCLAIIEGHYCMSVRWYERPRQSNCRVFYPSPPVPSLSL